MKFADIFKKIDRLSPKLIDVETLQVWCSDRDCARDLGVSQACVCTMKSTGYRIKGHIIEEIDDWMWWSDAEKEKYTRKNNIYFLRGNNEKFK